MRAAADQTLQEVCGEIGQRLAKGEAWTDIIAFVVAQPAIQSEVRRQAGRFHWVDRSLSVDDLAADVLGIMWSRLRWVKAEEMVESPKTLVNLIRQCFWHLPQSRERRRAERSRARGDAALTAVEDDILQQTSGHAQTLAEYQERNFEAALETAIASLP